MKNASRQDAADMEPSARARSIASELLSTAHMPEAEAQERTSRALDREHWLRLAPGLTIGAAPRPSGSTLAPAVADATERHFRSEGYCQMPPILEAPQLARLNGAIDSVVADGWPPVFAWVYDELWALAHHGDVRRLVMSQLGDSYSQIPHIWTHVVPAVAGSAGWTPHFDGPTGGRLSVWIALTDATLTNGCMHVVPRRLLPTALSTEPLDTGRVAMVDAYRALQGVRALPVTQGSLLAWSFDVLHWGGRARRGGAARRSLSFEYIAASETPRDHERPVLPLASDPPSPADRLRAIAAGVLEYRRFEPLLMRFEELARRILG